MAPDLCTYCLVSILDSDKRINDEFCDCCQQLCDHDWELQEEYHVYSYIEESTDYWERCNICGLSKAAESYDGDD